MTKNRRTEAHRQAARERTTRLHQDPAYRARWKAGWDRAMEARAARAAAPATPAEAEANLRDRANRSAAMRRQHKDPVWRTKWEASMAASRAKRIAAIREALKDEGRRARISEAARAAWARPGYRENYAATRKRNAALAAAGLRPKNRRQTSKEKAMARHAESDEVRFVRSGMCVPAWVEAAGLRAEFITIALLDGEEEAASWCRRNKPQRSAA